MLKTFKARYYLQLDKLVGG